MNLAQRVLILARGIVPSAWASVFHGFCLYLGGVVAAGFDWFDPVAVGLFVGGVAGGPLMRHLTIREFRLFASAVQNFEEKYLCNK